MSGVNMSNYLIPMILFSCFSQSSMARDYGRHDPGSVVLIEQAADGEQGKIDLQHLDRIIDDLAVHAMNYPPHFESAAAKERAIRDAKVLSGLLEIVVNKSEADPGMLKRSGLVNNIAHNLDIPGSAEKADRDFRNLLAQYPEDPEGNYMYGAFLGGANRGEQAVPYLEKAASLGVAEAYYSIGMAYLLLGDTELAIKNLEMYEDRKPGARDIRMILKAINSGNFKRHSD